MSFQITDVFVSGGGIAGMVAALAFERAGFSVICADPVPPVTTQQDNGADLRTTAFLQPSKTFLQSIGIWNHLAEHAMPLEVMRIVDAGGAIEPPALCCQFQRAQNAARSRVHLRFEIVCVHFHQSRRLFGGFHPYNCRGWSTFVVRQGH